MSSIAICILNFNGEKILAKFLPSVIANRGMAKIFVIDNASTDNSLGILQQYKNEISIVHNSKNSGYAGGYNEGLKKINADIYVLLNSDVEVTPNWIEPVVALINSDKNIATCQPKIKDFKNKKMFEYAGAAGGFIDAYGYPYCNGRVFNKLEHDISQYETNYEIAWSSGAALFIKSKFFWECGAFDEDFFAHQEEIDLCWRLHNKGYKNYYCHNSTVYHLGGATLNNTSPFKTYLNFRNNLFLLIKNDLRWYWFLVFFCRLILDGIAGVFFILKGKGWHCLAIIKAHFNCYFHLLYFYRKRMLLKKGIQVKAISITKSNYIPLPFLSIDKL